MAEPINSGDLVLPNDSYAHVLDETKGHITCYVGPSKTQLANTDKLVTYDEELKRYRQTNNRDIAVQTLKVAPEGWYIVLKNPASNRKQPAPSSNTSLDIGELEIGRKIHIPGPISMALWPGQMAKVVQGHHLRTNQYLIIRVYDAKAAMDNWGNTIIQKTSAIESKPLKPLILPAGGSDEKLPEETKEIPPEETVEESILAEKIEFTVGKLMIVKGTDVSFFIPPTGIEVVRDLNGSYIREAVTLERLFYCILLDEGGSKRYIRGPAVVFPSPTEIFQTHENNGNTTRKFRAIELNDISGLYIKVIAPYKDEITGKEHQEGDELFITGKQQSIYYRRDEHQIVRYGRQEVHYATAIPKGEARYVLDRLNGEIETVYGPAMLLPDPRTKVIVRRVIPVDLCRLLYPGNNDALAYNDKLTALGAKPTDFVTDNQYANSSSHDDELGGEFQSRVGQTYMSSSNAVFGANASSGVKTRGIPDMLLSSSPASKMRSATASLDGGILEKSSTYTQPRTVTLGSKYDGALRVKIWTGYAIIVVDGNGKRKVVEGPATYNMAYDEYPEVITMSTGKPKNTDKILRDIYLRTKNNKISDIITVETKDLVNVSMKLSYRVNFIENKDVWFNVENYVKFLCDHMRSKLKGFAQTISLSDFYADSVKYIRDVVLGAVDKEGAKRGFLFPENNMFVGDVEVLSVDIQDREIASTILETQQEIVSTTIAVSRKAEMVSLKSKLAELEKQEKAITASQLKESFALDSTKLELEQQLIIRKAERDNTVISVRAEQDEFEQEHRLGLKLSEVEASIERQQTQDEAELKRQSTLNDIHESANSRERADKELDIEFIEKEAAVEQSNTKVNAAAVVEQFKAVQPGLVEALQANAQIAVLSEVLPSAIPLSIVEGQSVSATLGKLLKGTSVGKIVDNLNPTREGEDE